MSVLDVLDWQATNRDALLAELARIRTCLEQATVAEGVPMAAEPMASDSSGGSSALGSSALGSLARAFGLTDFERSVLVMCAGLELDPTLGSLCARANGDDRRPYPTFGLALDALAGGHWSATTPRAPLRFWRLISVEPGPTLMASPLAIDERVLHHLAGVAYIDTRLESLLAGVELPDVLPHSYRRHAERIASLLSGAAAGQSVIHVDAPGARLSEAIAAAGCAAAGLGLHAIRASQLPASAAERATVARLCDREAVLSRSALLLEGDPGDDPAVLRAAGEFVELLAGPTLVAGSVAPRAGTRQTVRIRVERPATDEQRAIWSHALGPVAERLDGQLDAVIAQFQLDVDEIVATGKQVRESAPGQPVEAVAALLWGSCRARARTALDQLGQRLDSGSQWVDLVLPNEQLRVLHEISAQVRHRARVYEEWGFAARGPRGLGISALFTGPSGTGKTLAAEVLANDLRLDLFRIDLSQVVSKYIGETEKNLRAVFDAAEACGAILLFDEADALFGRRSEVRDSHDRYANIEVSYLLQRMESYRGLAILTSNQRAALDTAFLRRLRFVVTFPFPDSAQRARIWQGIFPEPTPLDDLDIARLGQLTVTGGNIRNIAVNAAFLAAADGGRISMTHLARAARDECAKIEKPVAAAELAGWT